MKFSLSWLKQHLNTDLSAEKLAERMVQLGLEVEGIEQEGSAFNRVVVGKLISRTQHPDADKLGVCIVETGEAEPRQIVCGAPNARDGLTIAVALDGAVLPGDFKIKPTKMRGVTSNGMICSVRELGFGEEHDGIWEMDTDAVAGTPLAEALNMNDVIFDVSMTPNRGDALSVYGIARDLAACGAGTLNVVEKYGSDMPAVSSKVAIDRKNENCRFFTGQLITDVKNSESPAWMIRFLEQAELRPINCIADITNYMLMTYGQPLHAYDADKLKGNIRVSAAMGGEKLSGLDGNTHTLAAGDMVIMDDSGIIGLAGIVGGESTSVDENTTNVYLEVAQFDKSKIALTGQRLQCNTDARYRFERGIDPSMTKTANVKAASLITELCGGRANGLDFDGTELPEVRVIEFAPSRVRTFGGLDISATETKTLLESLGFGVEVTGDDAFDVTVPHHCTIMGTDADLVEEVLRLKTLDEVPAVLPKLPTDVIVGADKGRKADRVARRTFASLGYLECLNYSFINQKKAEMFAEGATLLTLDNPLDEEEMSTMRPSLIPSLLDAAAKNLARSETTIRLAEVGKVYTETKETLKASALLMGKTDRHWKGSGSTFDVFDIKADLEAMLSSLGLPAEKLQVYSTNIPASFHPGRSGSFALGKNVFGTFGEVHPRVMKAFGLKGSAVAMDLNLEKIEAMNIKAGAFFTSNYQAVNRDFALLVNEDVNANDLINALKGADKELVRNVTLFDVYQGEGVAKGKKSVALSMTLQAADRTLSEDDINTVVAKVEKSVTKRFAAEIR